jgi:hypothetical protein
MTKLKTRLPLAIPHSLQIPTNWTPGRPSPSSKSSMTCETQSGEATNRSCSPNTTSGGDKPLSQNKTSTMIRPSELQKYPWNRGDTTVSLSLAERTHLAIPS